MDNAISPDYRRLNGPGLAGAGLPLALGVALWFALVVAAGAREAFVASVDRPPLALLLASAGSVLLFLAALAGSRPFREFVRALDVRFITSIQAWRIGGFVFLVLYSYGILPGYFAWPAAMGDMAIGITAPWILAALARRPEFVVSKTFVAWNLFGILDLIVAVGTAAFGRVFLAGAATDAMTRLPLVVIPAFLVPVFIILHVAALSRARLLLKENEKESDNGS